MGKPSKDILDFMERYKVDADEIWEVRAGGAWAIKHKALERVAAMQGITFEQPKVLEANGADKIVALCITARMGEREEWSIGEASPGNSKNAYPYAMAEKRGKDRCILKLLNAHGTLYSEDEIDEIKVATLPKKDAREIYTKLQNDIQGAISREQLKDWAEGNRDRIAVLPEDWQDILRAKYEEMMGDLRQKETA